jgi:hypothetical protein
MKQIGLIGLCAGTASALMFISTASGAAWALALANLAPLPIMIAAIGWTHHAAIVAVLLASAGLALVFGATVALTFLLAIGLPAWWIGYLALLARPAPGADPAGIEWYPLGRIVVWTAITAAAVALMSMLRHGLDAAAVQAGLRGELERVLRFLAGLPADAPLQSPGARDLDRLLDVLVLIAPPMKAIGLTLTSLFNLWLAALIARISGRLKRPWPAIAQMTFPPFAPTLLAIAVAGTFLPDLIGLASSVVTASLLLVYALLGFAVIHAVTTHIGGRRFMLSGLYLTVVLFGWLIVLMSLVGLIETMFGLRARHAARRPPPLAPPGSHNPL